MFAVNEQWRPTEGNKSDESIPAKTVSLLLTPAQAQVIYLAEAMGRIRLVLRNPDDNEVANTAGTDAEAILQSSLAGDRGKESGDDTTAKSDSSSSILKWLSQPKSDSTAQATPPQRAAAGSNSDFLDGHYKGDELHRVQFTRNGKRRPLVQQRSGGFGTSPSHSSRLFAPRQQMQP